METIEKVKQVLRNPAEANKLEGMQRAIDNAGPEWAALAYQALISFARENAQFMAEDVRLWAAHVPAPPSSRAWGPVIVRAQKDNIIRHSGYAKTRDPQAHNAVASVWESNICNYA